MPSTREVLVFTAQAQGLCMQLISMLTYATQYNDMMQNLLILCYFQLIFEYFTKIHTFFLNSFKPTDVFYSSNLYFI